MTHPRIVHDAKEMAGCFYEKDRSETFRATWPDQLDYVNAKWAHFVTPVRAAYAELLGHPGVSEEEKERMYDALTDDVEKVVSDGAQSPLQIIRDSEAFVGNRKENALLKATIGGQSRSLREKLRSTTPLNLLPR